MAREKGTDGPLVGSRRRWERAAREALGCIPSQALPPCLLPEPPSEQDATYLASSGFPGEYPFTRGIHPTMYRGRLWTFRQYSGFATARKTNQRFHYLLERGQTGLSVAFDLPTQLGYDSDHPRARGEVGRCGVAISEREEMSELLSGIPLDRATISMTINATAPILLAFLIAVAESAGIPRDRVGGTVQNDLLKEYVARGTYIYPPAASLRLTTDLIEFATREMPRWNSISVSGYHMREAGATAAQEISFTLANAIAYVRAAKERGLDPESFLPRLSFFFSSDRGFLEEIAKFRAARRLWASIVREELGVRHSRSMELRFHTQTAGSSLTAQQPELNVIRTTLETMAAVLGGTQSLHTNALDEAIGLPTEPSARLALRTQQVLAEESGIPSTIDPLAGAYEIEWLTDEIEREARAYLARVAGMGGAVAAVEKGFFQAEIAREAYRVARAREGGEELVVGVNCYPEGNPRFTLFPGARRAGVRGQRIGPADERRQAERVRRWKARRNTAKSEAALASLERSTRAGANVMPGVLSAVSAGATLGEISDLWRGLFGEQAPSRAF